MARRPPSPLATSRSSFTDEKGKGKLFSDDGKGKKGKVAFPDDGKGNQSRGRPPSPSPSNSKGKGLGKPDNRPASPADGKGNKGMGKLSPPSDGKGKPVAKGTPRSAPEQLPFQSPKGGPMSGRISDGGGKTGPGAQRPPSPFGGNVPRRESGKGSLKGPPARSSSRDSRTSVPSPRGSESGRLSAKGKSKDSAKGKADFRVPSPSPTASERGSFKGKGKSKDGSSRTPSPAGSESGRLSGKGKGKDNGKGMVDFRSPSPSPTASEKGGFTGKGKSKGKGNADSRAASSSPTVSERGSFKGKGKDGPSRTPSPTGSERGSFKGKGKVDFRTASPTASESGSLKGRSKGKDKGKGKAVGREDSESSRRSDGSRTPPYGKGKGKAVRREASDGSRTPPYGKGKAVRREGSDGSRTPPFGKDKFGKGFPPGSPLKGKGGLMLGKDSKGKGGKMLQTDSMNSRGPEQPPRRPFPDAGTGRARFQEQPTLVSPRTSSRSGQSRSSSQGGGSGGTRPFRAGMSPRDGSHPFPNQVGPMRSSPQDAMLPQESGPRRTSARSRTPSPKSGASPRGGFFRGFRREGDPSGSPRSGSPSPKASPSARLSPHRQRMPAWDTSSSSGLARRIVHPLFAVMLDPPEVVVQTPKRPSQEQARPMDVARRIADIGFNFASLLVAPAQDSNMLKPAEGMPAEVLLAGISLGLYIAGQEKDPNIDVAKLAPGLDPRELAEAWKEWKAAALQPMSPETLEARDASYQWLKGSRLPLCNLKRLVGVATTLESGFLRLRSKYGMPCKSDLVMRTEIVDFMGDFTRPTRLPETSIEIRSSHEPLSTLAQREAVHHGQKVAILHQASAHMIGGAFITGGCHCLEEELCMQSTLFFSLQQAAILAERKKLKDCFGHEVHIPEYGVVLSPCVDVFRQSSQFGYECAHDYELSAILSYTLPNCDPERKDVLLDERTPDQYERLLDCKFRAALKGAASVGAEVLIIADPTDHLGNHSMSIGRALGKALCCCQSQLRTVYVLDTELQKSVVLYYKGFKEDLPHEGTENSDFRELSLTIPPELETTEFMPSLFTLGACKRTLESEWAKTAEHPQRTECARQLGVEIRMAALDHLRVVPFPDPVLEQIMAKHSLHEDYFPAHNLCQCLTDYQNREVPPHDELCFMARSHMPFVTTRRMVDTEVVDAICAWSLHNIFKKDLEMVFYLYDDASRGKLDELHLRLALEEICGEAVTSDEMKSILAEETKINQPISRSEFVEMIVRWHAASAGKAIRERHGTCFSRRTSCIKSCFPLPPCADTNFCCDADKFNGIMATIVAGATGRLQQGNQRLQESNKLRRQWLV